MGVGAAEAVRCRYPSLVITTAARRLAVASALVATCATLVLGTAVAASADTPEPRPGGWEAEPPVDGLHAFLVLGGIPLLLFVVITLLYVAPALARGENLRPSALEVENQWIGGPRKAAGELAAPDTDDSKAGGAGGSW